MRWLLIIIFLIFVSLAAAENPPSLTEFQQFYGQITSLPAGSYTIKAKVGANSYTTSVAADGKYGYSPAFKVRGSEGQLIEFLLVSGRTETPLSNSTYQNQAITKLDFVSPLAAGAAGVDGADDAAAGGSGPPAGDGAAADSSAPADSNVRPRVPGGTGASQEEEPLPASCLYNWECSGWSICSGSRQSRTCSRTDNCDSLEVQGVSITKIPRPEESRACEEGKVMPGMSCSPGTKRCQGKNLQQCAADGSVWMFVEACSDSCDAASLKCVAEDSAKTKTSDTQKPQFPWIYPLIGSAVLVIVIIVVVFFFYNRSKYAPGREYVEEERGKGITDSQIRARLSSQGWTGSQIEKLMK